MPHRHQILAANLRARRNLSGPAAHLVAPPALKG